MMAIHLLPGRCALLALLVFLLLLFASSAVTAVCEYDGPFFTFLEIDENGLITWDDLSFASYEVMVCEVDGPPYNMGCDYPEDYHTVTTPSYQTPDFDPEKVYWYGITGYTADDCFVDGRARDYWPPEEEAEEETEEEESTDPPPVPVLLPPENVTFDPGGTTVTWDAVPDADGYIVEWRQDEDDPWIRVETDDTSYDIPNFDTAIPGQSGS